MRDRYLLKHVRVLIEDVAPETVRNWAEAFEEYLSLGANPPKGSTRYFTFEDLRVFATVARMRKDENASTEDIIEVLKSGWRDEVVDVPDQLLDVVSGGTGLAIVDTIRNFEKRLSVVEQSDQNRVKEELERFRQENRELLMEIGKLRALLEIEKQKHDED